LGSVGGNYDNAVAETVDFSYGSGMIYRRLFEAAGFATLDGVGWFNHRCLIEPVSNIPSAKLNNDIMPCRNSPQSPPDLIRSTAGTHGAIQPNHSERL
jgi:putative transposase